MSHPRDRYITVYGRKPVLEALEDGAITVDKVLLARGLRGPVIKAIARAAKTQKIQLTRMDTAQINRISRNARQDQSCFQTAITIDMLSTLEKGRVGKQHIYITLKAMGAEIYVRGDIMLV